MVGPQPEPRLTVSLGSITALHYLAPKDECSRSGRYLVFRLENTEFQEIDTEVSLVCTCIFSLNFSL